MTAMAATETWPVALERDVQPGSLVRSALGETALVLWRCDRNEIHVWEDNCPHRSVRFSAGRNLGDCIEDIYHGWRFGHDGALVFIHAAQDKALPQISARTLSTITASGLVWASTAGLAVPPQDFAMAEGEVLMRPLPFAAEAATVAAACAGLQDMRILASPTGERSATAYGYVRRRQAESEREAARRANAVMSGLRRKVEAAA